MKQKFIRKIAAVNEHLQSLQIPDYIEDTDLAVVVVDELNNNMKNNLYGYYGEIKSCMKSDPDFYSANKPLFAALIKRSSELIALTDEFLSTKSMRKQYKCYNKINKEFKRVQKTHRLLRHVINQQYDLDRIYTIVGRLAKVYRNDMDTMRGAGRLMMTRQKRRKKSFHGDRNSSNIGFFQQTSQRDPTKQYKDFLGRLLEDGGDDPLEIIGHLRDLHFDDTEQGALYLKGIQVKLMTEINNKMFAQDIDYALKIPTNAHYDTVKLVFTEQSDLWLAQQYPSRHSTQDMPESISPQKSG